MLSTVIPTLLKGVFVVKCQPVLKHMKQSSRAFLRTSSASPIYHYYPFLNQCFQAGHLRFCQQPRKAHALRSDQLIPHDCMIHGEVMAINIIENDDILQSCPLLLLFINRTLIKEIILNYLVSQSMMCYVLLSQTNSTSTQVGSHPTTFKHR